MATVSDALAIARTLLNDDNGLEWHDMALMPKLKQAHGELVSKLALNGIPVQNEETAWLTVLTGAVVLTGGPTDIIEPIQLKEKGPTDPIANSVGMQRVEFLPDVETVEVLRYWAWKEQEIQFLGATRDRQVQLKYIKSSLAPALVTDTLYFTLSETFIGPRVAALAKLSKGDNAGYATVNQIAETNLSKLVRTQVKGGQSLPVRRRPFSARRRRFIT